MSSTSLILVRDSSPLRPVFVHNAPRGGLHTDLTNLCFVVQAASFVQAWRSGSIPIWRRLLNSDAVFDSSSSISLADVVYTLSSTPLNPWETRHRRPKCYSTGRRPFPSISNRALFVDSLLGPGSDSSMSCASYSLGCSTALLGISGLVLRYFCFGWFYDRDWLPLPPWTFGR